MLHGTNIQKVVNSIIKRVSSQSPKRESGTNEVENVKKVFLNVHYAGNIGDQLIKQCWRKLKRRTNGNVNFITMYSVTKISFFTNMTDRIQFLSKSYVVYEFTCPGCTASYIGMTKRTLFQRTKEHLSREESAIKMHIENCLDCEHLFGISNLLFNDVSADEFKLNLIRNNTKVLDTGKWDTLEFKEAFFIKEKKPVLNNGIKALKELQLF